MTSCDAVREWIQDRLDGPVPAERSLEIERHLAGCVDCRELDEGLRRVREELRSLPEVPFPDEALEAVWRKTVGNRSTPRRRAPVWWLAAAAAAALLVAALLLRTAGPAAPSPSPAEIARAEHDARLALGFAAHALRATERAAVRRVLAGEVSPVLRRIPVRWPKTADPDPFRSRT